MKKKNNYFKYAIEPLIKVFHEDNKDVFDFIQKMLTPLYKQHNVNLKGDLSFIESHINNINEIRDKISINTKCEESKTIVNRTEIISNQIGKFIKQQYPKKAISLADIGCGDGMVPYYLANKENIKFTKPILLTDVIDYLNPDVKSDELFHFIKTETEQWSSDILKEVHNDYDVVLLLTVLHHSTSPSDILSNIPELLKKGGLLLVIESNIGVTEEDIVELGHDEKVFASFSLDKQILYATFIDWFYNKLLIYNHEVPVPFNFSTHNKWKDLIEQYGLVQERVTLLGFDQKLAPEFHSLHIFKML